MNKIISIIALLLILPIFKVEAYDFVIDEITYNFTKEHGTVEVSGLREFLNLEPGDRNSSLPLVVNIPPVVTYKDNKYDVVSIGYAAFQGCRKVTEIKIPSTVREIGEFAFENCSKLEIINIPDSVKMIGRCTFYNCSGLKKVIYGSVIVPEKTFYGCSSLTEVKLLDSVKFIGEEAFESCTSLVSIDLPYLVEEIGKRSFRGCTSLSNINFPLSLRKIGANAFQGCINLKKVELPKRLEQYRYDFEDTTKFKWIK
ncbi:MULTISPECIES: leucine-rich repeat domain-containing protein [unclassified Bacteroides]|uniref:leucine-rich repeat domain-containing protein n=1 Tax=unclassified Bacteroides TaxID=2646097 RepID=UPI001C37959C|nr:MULTISPECIES: leucine-rich repeat domain-containing protein [unclassified Bacteroides]MBV3659858.1 leucine-rich repeat domain-containing protein [Bacteroides sp. MSK.18.91]MBV3670865.1 leucine-rich repeat domain-containing protein [Bacteroides sp. MSK.18.83]MBV3715254.1 leucine-rich repeat domain-containing protein [Bacteroides sp. MSK.18.39]MBV3741796.1 leucine-rich repeat domain-containing protein [Bacteroides sp. MSK.18.37]MBV3757433.1 leucine-rich repeat domain-containing protein [Bacte